MKSGLKLVIGITALGLSSHVMAWDEFYGSECYGTDVFIGAPCYTLDAGFRAIWYQPSASNLHYAAVANPLPVPSPHWNIYDVKSDYNFGFEVDLTTVFHERGTKLALSWEHFENNNSSNVAVPASEMVGPFFEIGPDAAFYQQAHGKVKWYFDQINLDYGAFVNFGDAFQTNLFVGIFGARIKETNNVFYTGTLPVTAASISRNIDSPSTFSGGGPRVGLDFSFRVWDDFRLTGQAAAGILVGTFVNHTQYQSIFPVPATVDGVAVSSPNNQSTTVKNRYGIVPEVEGRLGFAYDFTFCDDFFVKLEAGYEAKVFIGAIQSVDMGSEVVTPPLAPDVEGVFARTFQRTISNFALAGPYVSINIGF